MIKLFFPFINIFKQLVDYIYDLGFIIYNNLLLIVMGITLIAIFWLFFEDNSDKIRQIAIWFANIILLVSSFLYLNFDNFNCQMQFMFSISWASFYNVHYTLGIDGISIFFVLLTTLLIVVCVLVSWESIQYRVREFMILLFLIEFLLINVFSVLDLFLFYVFFEGILIPMFIMIGVWGSRERKIHAAYQFFLYTLGGSVLMLLAIIYIYIHEGTTYWGNLLYTSFTFEEEIVLWFAIFASLAVKIPMFPVHIWLPEAHVEAPTAGSVLLAGVLLKMGGYGFLRFLIPVFPTASHYFSPAVFILAILGIVYSSFTTIRQIDLKKIIAYSSVGHMNYVMLGIFSGSVEGIEGAILLMVSHGIVSSGLFMCVGILYDRYKTRIIEYYGGLVSIMPIFSLLFFILTIANIGFPGTSSFVGEILILVALVKVNSLVAVLGATGMILGAVYSIWLYNRVIFSEIKVPFINFYEDLQYEIDPQSGMDRETFMLMPLIFLVFLIGIYPDVILDSLHGSVYRVVELQNIIK